MTPVRERFWAAMDEQIAGDVARTAERPASPRRPPAPIRGSAAIEPHNRLPIAAVEWSGVLDIINDARVHAEEQKEQLEGQAEAFRKTIQELRQEVETIQRQVCVSEANAREAKAEAEAQVGRIFAEAEDRVRIIQAKADDQIAQARDSALAAEKRAAAAEAWLQRIDDAARTLAATRQAASIHRAA